MYIYTGYGQVSWTTCLNFAVRLSVQFNNVAFDISNFNRYPKWNIELVSINGTCWCKLPIMTTNSVFCLFNTFKSDSIYCRPDNIMKAKVGGYTKNWLKTQQGICK